MDSEIQDIEDTLKVLRPASLAPASMDRFLAAIEGRGQAVDPTLASVEKTLNSMTPLSVPVKSAEVMLATVSAVPFPVDEKVVLFPGASKPTGKPASRRPWYAAAAAVAVAGAFSAMMVEQPGEKSGGSLVGSGSAIPLRQPTGFVPASVGSGLEEAKDEGVMWTTDGKPVRMVRVIYMDKAKYRSPQGEIIEVDRPRVEYLMVPEKID
jgi:hypothetical protein